MGTPSPDKAYILEASWAMMRRVSSKSLLTLAVVLVTVVLLATFPHQINDPMGREIGLNIPIGENRKLDISRGRLGH